MKYGFREVFYIRITLWYAPPKKQTNLPWVERTTQSSHYFLGNLSSAKIHIYIEFAMPCVVICVKSFSRCQLQTAKCATINVAFNL